MKKCSMRGSTRVTSEEEMRRRKSTQGKTRKKERRERNRVGKTGVLCRAEAKEEGTELCVQRNTSFVVHVIVTLGRWKRIY